MSEFNPATTYRARRENERYPEKRKPGRKPIIHDLANYFCPKCEQQPVEKSPHKNMCVTCYRGYTNEKTKAWYAKNRGKGYGKRGRPPSQTGTQFGSEISARYLSMSLHPVPSRP